VRGRAAEALGKISGSDANRALGKFREEQIQMEQERLERLSQPEEINRLITELIEIGFSDGFLSSAPGGKFDDRRRHIRAREIGKLLDQIGGLELMRKVFYEVARSFSPGSGREPQLNSAWNLIGEWLA